MIVLKKYKLATNNLNVTKVTLDNFEQTTRGSLGFVSCLTSTGISYGIVRNMEVAAPKPYDPRCTPILFTRCSPFYARIMYERYKKEKERFSNLAKEIEKETEKQQKLITEKKQNDIEFMKQENSHQYMEDDSINQQSRGKRLSLNNGIFTQNDNY